MAKEYQVALCFEDGVTKVIDCREGERLADAAYRHRVYIPIDCRDGACGTCKCRIESGEFDLGDFIEDALSEAEIGEHLGLACQMMPQADGVVQIQASSQACRVTVMTVNVQIEAVHRHSPRTFELTVKADELERMAFLGGQYVNVEIPETGQTRAYSFASTVDKGRVSFLIRYLPGGLMSEYLANKAQAGHHLQLSGPRGSFYLRPVDRPVLMIAGGTGLAPFLAMLDELVAKGEAPKAPIRLYYGVNDVEELVVAQRRLDEFAAQVDGFEHISVVADRSAPVARRGYITEHLAIGDLNGGDVDVYMCGPAAMQEACRAWLRAQPVQAQHLYVETFLPTASAETLDSTL